ncbi:hypothetical protein BRI6_0156 [plant metagenome]
MAATVRATRGWPGASLKTTAAPWAASALAALAPALWEAPVTSTLRGSILCMSVSGSRNGASVSRARLAALS